jgi:polysaccharide biosynthesis/export protein
MVSLLFSLLLAAGITSDPPATEYRIGPRDVLSIAVMGHPDLSQSFVVQEDGSFSFPLLGHIVAGDRTAKQLQDLLVQRLSDGFIREPQVAVAVQEYRSKSVLVVGEVARPGSYPLSGGMTLVELLSKAGPLSPNASSEAVIVKAGRPAAATTDAPDADAVRINLRAMESGDKSENRVLEAGDTVFFPQAPKVFVSGEVRQPGAYPFGPGTTVRQVVILAGGFTEDASTKAVRILRAAEGKPSEIKVGLDEVVKPGDTVVVRAKLF